MRGGDLQQACRLARRSGCLKTRGGPRVARQLVDRLIERAGRYETAGNLVAAWDDLSAAVRVQPGTWLDELSRRQNRLVETTVARAEACLQRGKPAATAELIGLLRNRKIADRRADELEAVCRLVADAEARSGAGQWAEATGLLEQAARLRPDLEFVESRICRARQGKQSVAELTAQLRHAINRSRWGDGQELSVRILQIAPDHAMARDARRHCLMRLEQSVASDLRGSLQRTASAGQGQPSNAVADDETPVGRNRPDTPVPQNPPAASPAGRFPAGSQANSMSSFMLWLDGVGGYLVCTTPQVTIGRAVEQAGVEIALQADIRRRHLQIQRFGNRYLARPLGGYGTGQAGSDDAVVLQSGQTIPMGGGVESRFTVPHPLGGSARIEFTSRHRTEPWSDAVLLMGDALLIGRSDAHHIRAPGITEEIMVFRQGDEILLRSPGPHEVDGNTGHGDVVLQDGMRICGPGFSITVEQIFRNPGNDRGPAGVQNTGEPG